MDFCFIIKCFVHVLFCFVFIYLTCVIVPGVCAPHAAYCVMCAGPNIFRGVSVQLVARPRPLSTWGPRIPPAVGGFTGGRGLRLITISNLRVGGHSGSEQSLNSNTII